MPFLLKNNLLPWFVGLLVVSPALSVWAQSGPVRGNLRLLGGLGVSYYDGDLRSDRLRQLRLRPNLSVGLSYRLNDYLSLRGEAGAYRLYGSDAGGKNWQRNLSFRTDNPEGYVALSGNLLPYSNFPTYNVYAFGGLGLTHLNPKARFQGRYYSLPRLRTEGVAYARTVAIVPIGLGVLRHLNDRWDVALEIRYTYVASDYLDDVSTVYPDPAGIDPFAANFSDRSPELGLPPNAPGVKRGNPGNKDSYYFIQLRLEHPLGSSRRAAQRRMLRCPKW
jgi:hypothetical protein